jgi:hypothetical protein
MTYVSTQGASTLAGRGFNFEHFVKEVNFLLQVMELQEEVAVLLVVESLTKGLHVIIVLLLP